MKKLLLSMSLAVCFGANSQTILFQDDFEAGSGNWTLNIGGFGANDWIVNNVFFGSFLTNTPTQPGAITNSPQSQYLHIYNAATACGGLGDCQAVFLASSGGDKTAAMTNSISTIGQTSVAFNFWYLCMGAITTYGTVEYSIDNGATWLIASPNYQGTINWTSQSLTNPAWDNQAQLKFRFRWTESTVGNDPAFSVDQVVITGIAGMTNSITTTNDVTPASWCTGTAVSGIVNFVATGTFNVANVYSAELSDATGAFGSPTVVGTLSSSASGSLSITTTIPGAIPAGNGYRIRVVASDPATTGTDNSTDLVSNPLPTVTLGTFSDVCINHSASTLTGGTPAGGTYSGTGVTAGMFDPGVAGVGTHTITYTFTDGNSCTNSAAQPIVVDACASISEFEKVPMTIFPNPTSATFSILTDGIVSQVRLLDMSGRTIKSFDVNNASYNVHDLNSGVYLLQITNNGVIQTSRLVIQ